MAVVAPTGNSDHSSLSAVISMDQVVPNLCVSRKVFLEYRVNWKKVCGGIQDLPLPNIWSVDSHIKVLTSCWLDVMYQPWLSMCTTRTGLYLIINEGFIWSSSRRLIIGPPVIALGLTVKSLSAAKWELKNPTRRLIVSLVSGTWMFLWMSITLISGGQLLSLLCSAACARHFVNASTCWRCGLMYD